MNENTNNGIGFCGVLALIFIVLKLLHVIDWSWWWVLSPIWIPVLIWFFVFILILGIFKR